MVSTDDESFANAMLFANSSKMKKQLRESEEILTRLLSAYRPDALPEDRAALAEIRRTLDTLDKEREQALPTSKKEGS